MKVLRLKLKKKWFDMIDSGEKKEEYREMKDYWFRRLTDFFDTPFPYSFKHFDVVQFEHGYAKNPPTMAFEITRIGEGIPRPEWSDGVKERHFIIFLGKRLSDS